MSQQQQNPGGRAMAWDPTCPTSLCLLTNDDAASNASTATTTAAASSSSLKVDYWYSDTGSMSCNAHELAALYAILKAHDIYHADMRMLLHHHEHEQADGIGAGGSMSMLQAFTSLSRACRAAVLQCCEGWEQEIIQQQQQEHQDSNNNNNSLQESVQNLELLKTMHAVLHLSDIFLPLLPTDNSGGGIDSFGGMHDMYDSTHHGDGFEKPGAVTADTIRYLRYNHLDYANALHPAAIAEMLSLSLDDDNNEASSSPLLSHPEEYEVEVQDENGNNSSSTTVNLYWWYISTLVKRGCLEQVWETLQLHSLYRAAMSSASATYATAATVGQDDTADNCGAGLLETENDAYYSQTMQNVRHAFFILRMILLRAPLPGGRNDMYDTALGTPDYQDSDDNEIDGADDNSDNMEDDYKHFLQGLDVSPRDYKYWETASATNTSNSTTSAAGMMGLDLPMNYNSPAAMRKHETWQRFVQDLRSNFGLLRRIPELDCNILAILAGDFDNNNAYSRVDDGVTFANWTERLCAELLYKRPNLSPRELHIVTRRYMKQFMGIPPSGGGSSGSNRQKNNKKNDNDTATTERLLMEHSPMAAMVLQIMDGHAGQAIETMYMLGGGSGAALPATLTALLYTMCLESSIMPPEAAFRKTEFICQAASAIVSSLGGGGLGSRKQQQHVQHDVGAKLAIQLLLPYTWPDAEYGGGGGDKTARTQIIALIANILEHCNPRSESSARDLIDTCMPLMTEQQSVVILEACVSIVLCRFRKALKDQDEHENASYSRTAMQWLWQGMQLEAMVLQPAGAATMMGSCHCTLSSWCYQTAFDLVNSSAKTSVINPLTFQAATEMVNTVREAALGGDDGNGSGKVSPLKIAQVRQLVCIQELFDTFSLQSDYARAAAQIVDSLQETTTTSIGDGGAVGTVATLVPFSMYLPLLQIAQQILVLEEATHEWNTQNPSCAFDKRGVSVLMQTLTRVTAFSSSSDSSSATTTTGTVVMTKQQEMELSQLLARALARAFVAENAKKKKSLAAQQQQQQHAHGGVDIALIRSGHLSLYSPSIQEAVVQRMLDM